jgi:hypothetical protein
MTTHEILTAARKVIEKPEHFSQRTYARDKDGMHVSYLSTDAVAFCAAGAMGRVITHDAPTELGYEVVDLLDAAARAQYPGACPTSRGAGIVYVNDTLGHEATLAMFDEAIRRAAA